MNFRLKTTAYTGEVLKSLQSSTGLTPNLLARLAITYSITEQAMPEEVNSESKGLEFNRTTLTGDQDLYYKFLIKQHANKEISEEDYFPKLFNAHLERGVKILENEYKHAGNYEKLLNNIIQLAQNNLKEVL